MATQTSGNGGAAAGHQQSIGANINQPVDGIDGSHPGTLQPSGADVDAGGAGAGPGQRHDESDTDKAKADPLAYGSSTRGLSGMNGRGQGWPGGASGALGSHAQQLVARVDPHADLVLAGSWTGCIAHGGQSVAVRAGSGSLSRQHSSGK